MGQHDTKTNFVNPTTMEPGKVQAVNPKKPVVDWEDEIQALSVQQWERQTLKSPDDFD